MTHERTRKPIVDVYGDDFETAVKHGMELYWSDSTPKKRLDQRGGRSGFTRFVNARVEGKLTEVAFGRFLEHEYGIQSQVDWRIYGDYDETDDGDLQYIVDDDGNERPPAVEFDVKKTKPWNQWLAIRTEVYESIPDDAPIILGKMILEDDMVVDEWQDAESWTTVRNQRRFDDRLRQYTNEHFPMSVEFVGSAYPDEFTDEFDEGDRLYDPDTGRKLGGGLRRDNVGIHVSDLNCTVRRWNRIVDEITDDYPIEYDEL